jgi:hypothetical protein
MSIGILQQARKTGPTEHQQMHLARITEACELLRAYMHDADGTMPPTDHQQHHWSSRRMDHAATVLEIAEMLAWKAVLE